MYIKVSMKALRSALHLFSSLLQPDTFPTMRKTSWLHIFNNRGKKRTNCSKAGVRCVKRKWVNRRLLGVNYVHQTMGLTELANGGGISWRYVHTTVCVSVCRAHAGPEQTAILSCCCCFPLSDPCDSNASQIRSCSTGCKTRWFKKKEKKPDQTMFLLFCHPAGMKDIRVSHGAGSRVMASCNSRRGSSWVRCLSGETLDWVDSFKESSVSLQ